MTHEKIVTEKIRKNKAVESRLAVRGEKCRTQSERKRRTEINGTSLSREGRACVRHEKEGPAPTTEHDIQGTVLVRLCPRYAVLS